jgi:hypothetical protein
MITIEQPDGSCECIIRVDFQLLIILRNPMEPIRKYLVAKVVGRSKLLRV